MHQDIILMHFSGEKHLLHEAVVTVNFSAICKSCVRPAKAALGGKSESITSLIICIRFGLQHNSFGMYQLQLNIACGCRVGDNNTAGSAMAIPVFEGEK